MHRLGLFADRPPPFSGGVFGLFLGRYGGGLGVVWVWFGCGLGAFGVRCVPVLAFLGWVVCVFGVFWVAFCWFVALGPRAGLPLGGRWPFKCQFPHIWRILGKSIAKASRSRKEVKCI